MTETTKRVFVTLIISCLINQFNINAQVITSVASNQPISNSTLLSYTSQSSITVIQTASPVSISTQLSNTNATMATITANTAFSLTTMNNTTRRRYTANRNITRMTSATIAFTTQQQNSTTSPNVATKHEQYLTLLLLVDFLLFISPIH